MSGYLWLNSQKTNRFKMNKSTKTINIFLKNYAKKVKQAYYQSLLKDCQNDMKQMWQIMKKITGKVNLTLIDFINQ